MAQLLPVPTVSISNENWAKITERSGLPAEARLDVERAASLYMMSDIGSSLDQTRKELGDTEKALRSARSTLEKLSANPRAIGALSITRGSSVCSENGTPAGKLRTDLDEAVEKLASLADFISTGRLAIKNGKPGAHENALRVALLVALLDNILFNFTKKHISRSSNRDSPAEYIAAVCKAGDFRISKFRIDGAIKQITKTRRRIERGEIAPFPPA